jgi:hypothetical protein
MIARLRAWWQRRRTYRALDERKKPGAWAQLKLDTKRWTRIRKQGARAADAAKWGKIR